MKLSKVLPFFAGSGFALPSAAISSGPHVLNSSTFSSMMTLGLHLAAQRSVTQARPRIFFSTGLPPLALEKCLQSGGSHTRPTGRLLVTLIGSTSHTLSHRCVVCGWFAACMASASGSWLMAISTGRPNACSRPVLVPPPPAKLSMISSLPRSSAMVKRSRFMSAPLPPAGAPPAPAWRQSRRGSAARPLGRPAPRRA